MFNFKRKGIVMKNGSSEATEVNKMKINRHGTIEVLRGKQLKKLFCPHRHYNDIKTGRIEAAFCGDECALFGKPQIYSENLSDDYVYIELCGVVYCCRADNFVDERIQEN